MRKNKLLLLLALLMTAATGARADWTGGTYTATANENLGAITVNGDATLTINSDVTVTVTGGINVASGTLTVTGPGTLVVTGAKGNNGASGWEGSNGSNGGVAISGNIIVQGGATVTATGGTGGNGGSGAFEAGSGGNGGVAFAGTLTYKSGTVTANGGSAGSGGYIDDEERYASSGSAGKAFANDVDFTQTTGYSVTNGTSTIGSVLNQTKVVISGGSEPAAAATYTVSLKDGVKDADKWTISPNPAEEGQTVTLQYNGRLKVKSVKAVKKAAPAYTMAAAATTSDKGKLICTAGHIHVYGEDAACTAGRVAKIIYVGPTGHATYNNGLALALEDMSTDPSTLFTWDKSGANNDGKTAAELCSAWNTSKPVTDAEWLLASKDQWNYMLGTNGAGSYTALRDGFESVGGSNLVEKDYWSSTEINDTQAWMFNFGYDWWYDYSKGTAYPQVRACLAF